MKLSKNNRIKMLWDLLRGSGVDDLDEDSFGKAAIYVEEEIAPEGKSDEKAGKEAAKKTDRQER